MKSPIPPKPPRNRNVLDRSIRRSFASGFESHGSLTVDVRVNNCNSFLSRTEITDGRLHHSVFHRSRAQFHIHIYIYMYIYRRTDENSRRMAGGAAVCVIIRYRNIIYYSQCIRTHAYFLSSLLFLSLFFFLSFFFFFFSFSFLRLQRWPRP